MKKYYLLCLLLVVSGCMDSAKPIVLEKELNRYDSVQYGCKRMIEEKPESMQAIAKECSDFQKKLSITNEALALKKRYKNDPRYLSAYREHNIADKKLKLQYKHLNLLLKSEAYRAIDNNDINSFSKIVNFPSHPMNKTYYNYMHKHSSQFKNNKKYRRFQRSCSQDKFTSGAALITQGKTKEGLALLKESGNMGSQKAAKLCGDVYFEISKEKSLNCYLKAVENGDSSSQIDVARLYEINEDEEKAFSWYEKSANSGNPIAKFKLYSLYKTGKGTEKDDQESMKWLTASADGGHAKGQYAYGMYLLKIKKNKEATKYLSASAEQEETAAYYPLGKLYFDGKAYNQAYQMLSKAKVSADSMYKLGYLKEYGKGTKRNYNQAYTFYKKALKLGKKKAKSDVYRVAKIKKKLAKKWRIHEEKKAVEKAKQAKIDRERKHLAQAEDRRLKSKWASKRAKKRKAQIRACGNEASSSNLAAKGKRIHLNGVVTQWLGQDGFIVQANGKEYYVEDGNDEARVNKGDSVNIVTISTGERKVIRGMRKSLFELPSESSIAKAYALYYDSRCSY